MPWHISERGGGAEVQANYLAVELAKRGFDVHYLCQTAHNNKIKSTEEINQFKVHWLKASGRFSWADQGKYFEPLNTIKPDLIIQRLSSNVTYVLGKYCKQNNCKLAWICTDNISPLPNYHLYRFKQRYSLKNTSGLKYGIFYLNNIIMDYFRIKGMRGVNVAFTQNEIQKKLVKQNFGLESFRMISGHPVPQIEITSEERLQKKAILWCANWGKHKCPELFLDLARQMEDTNYRFVMVGGHSDKNYVDKLLQNKPENLEITGQLSFDEALKYFDEATLFVNTSSPGGDGFPNTFIQAWLRGIPLITYGFDPNNVVHINKLGFVINKTKDAQYQIENLLKDTVLYKEIFIRVKEYAQNNHSIERMTDNFLNILKNENTALH